MIQRMTDWGDTVSWPYYYLYLLFFFLGGGGRLMTVDSSGKEKTKRKESLQLGQQSAQQLSVQKIVAAEPVTKKTSWNMGNTVSVATCYGRIKHQHQTSSATSSTSP
jgi:hypothetical protein